MKPWPIIYKRKKFKNLDKDIGVKTLKSLKVTNFQ